MNEIEETVNDGTLSLIRNGRTLTIPLTKWGDLGVRLDGEIVPSTSLWEIIGESAALGQKAPREDLFDEAERAEIYRQIDLGMMVWTMNPQLKDIHIADHVYARKEKQRVRPLVDKYRAVVGKIEPPKGEGLKEYAEEFGELPPKLIATRQLHNAAEGLKLKPFAAGDSRIMYSKDVDKIFEAFGTKDWVRLYVFFKRPGSSSVDLDLTETNELDNELIELLTA